MSKLPTKFEKIRSRSIDIFLTIAIMVTVAFVVYETYFNNKTELFDPLSICEPNNRG